MAKTNTKLGLTDKQKRFADVYIADPERNGQRAYMEAYACTKETTAKTNASRLLANPKVKSYVAEALEKQDQAIMERGILSHTDVLEKLKTVIEMSMGERERNDSLVVDGATVEFQLKRAELGVAHRAIETYGKYHKLWSDHKDDGPKVLVNFNINLNPR